MASEDQPEPTKFKIYTKTGDKGSSSLYNGERRSKTDAVFAALGDVDELNAAVGLAREFVCLVTPDDECAGLHTDLTYQLAEIQSRLLDVGSAVATPTDTSSKRKLSRTSFPEDATSMMEGWLDAMDEKLPALTAFILPSGGMASAHLHVARTVCRRAERAVVLLGEGDAVDESVAVFMNRLSDYLFCSARFMSSIDKDGKETVYKKVPEKK